MARTKKIRSKLAKVMSEEKELEETKEVYLPTEEECAKWARIINREVFDGKLPEFKEIHVRRRRGIWGECIGDEDEKGNRIASLSMNNKFKSRKFFLEVLVHEMVHLAEYIYTGKMGHGKYFNSWRDKLSEFNTKLV